MIVRAKWVAAVVVALGFTGWAASLYTQWKADLRFEGQRQILVEQRDSTTRWAEAFADSLAAVDAVRASEVERAREEAEADRERARRAEAEASRARARTATVADSVVELYGDTVRAAVEAVQAEHEVERASWRVAVSELRQAEARAWAALDTAQAQIADRDRIIAVKDMQLAQRDAIIERWERDSGGHGLATDLLIGLGGLAVGAIGASVGG